MYIKHNFKKHFGQNFLKDAKFTKLIAEKLDLSASDFVIEIGPGDGMLTRSLLDTGAKVLCIEVDYDLIPKLISKFHGVENFDIIHEDVLQVNLNELFSKYPDVPTVKVAGSLPFNIAKKIIGTFLKYNFQNKATIIDKMCFIVQEEVAKNYTDASLIHEQSSLYANIRKLQNIPANKFYPVPKVNGGIIYFDVKQEYIGIESDLEKFMQIGYSSPRKTLYNNLKSSNKYKPEDILKAFEEIGLNPKARAEELDGEMWRKLYEVLAK